MKQSTLFLIVAIVVALIGNVYVYQMKMNPNSGVSQQQQDNYQWNDSWGGSNDGQFDRPRQDPIETDPEVRPEKRQIVASDYKDAVSKSRQTGKPVLIFFEKNRCTYCDKMKREVLSDSRIRELMKKYVFVSVNVSDSLANRRLGVRYRVAAAPTSVIIDSNERTIGRVRGFQDVGNYGQFLSSPSRNIPFDNSPFRRGNGG